jgi:hypothetical protein
MLLFYYISIYEGREGGIVREREIERGGSGGGIIRERELERGGGRTERGRENK